MTVDATHYVHLVEEADVAADIISLIRKAIDDPAVFFYASLLHHRSAQQAMTESGDKGAQYQALLEILCYGTYADLQKVRGVADLCDAASLEKKVRVLTFLTCCATKAAGRSQLAYGEAMTALQCDTAAHLEEVVANSITDGLFAGRLDSFNQVIYIKSVHGREVPLNAIDEMIAKLKRWDGVCEEQIQFLSKALPA